MTRCSHSRKLGVYHVLVLAGLHVGALTAFFIWAGRRSASRPARENSSDSCRALCIRGHRRGPPTDRSRSSDGGAVFIRASAVSAHGGAEYRSAVSFGDSDRAPIGNQRPELPAVFLRRRHRSERLPSRGSQNPANLICTVYGTWQKSAATSSHPATVIQFRIEMRALTAWLAAHLPRAAAPLIPNLVVAPLRVCSLSVGVDGHFRDFAARNACRRSPTTFIA